MGRGAASVILVLLVTAASGCLGGGSFSVPAPSWQPGFTWAIDTGYEVRFDSLDEGVRENETLGGEGHYVLRIVNTTLAIDGVPVHLGVLEQDGAIEPVAYRRSDLAPLPLAVETIRSCGTGECLTNIQMLELEDETVPVWLDFPLRSGKTWVYGNSEDEGAFEIEYRYSARVAGRTTVETPMGDVSAIHIVKTVRIANLAEIRATLKEQIEADGITVEEFRVDVRVEAHEYYSEEFQNTIFYEETETSQWYLRGSEGETPFEEEESMRARQWQLVTGASLVAEPQMAVDAMGPILSGTLPIQDPSGDVIIPPPYTVAIDTEVGSMVEGESMTLRYRAVVDGEMDAAHKLAWRALDWSDNVVAQGGGTSFDFVPGVGAYRVQLLADDGAGTLVASAQAYGQVHYTAALDLDCGAAEVFQNDELGDCEAQPLPIHPGVDTALVVATKESAADPANFGELVLSEPTGTVAARGQDIVQMNDFRGSIVDGEPWTVDYVRQVGILETIRLDIDIRYGELPGGPPVPEPIIAPGPGGERFSGLPLPWAHRL